MAKVQKINYTKLRRGTVVEQWEYTDKKTGEKKIGQAKIVKCPKCGRNGKKTSYAPKDGKVLEMYTHKSHVDEVIPGFPLNHIDEQCAVTVEVKEGV